MSVRGREQVGRSYTVSKAPRLVQSVSIMISRGVPKGWAFDEQTYSIGILGSEPGLTDKLLYLSQVKQHDHF